MKKGLHLFLLLLGSISLNAQVGIGTDNPKATLDIEASNDNSVIDGILIPRVTREKAQQMEGVQESTLIYVREILTGTQTGKAVNIDTPGFYFFKSGIWVNLPDMDFVKKNSYWEEQGVVTRNLNSGRAASNNVEEDGDTIPEILRKNIFQLGKVGIGYSNEFDIDFNVNTSLKQLDVLGDFRTSTYFPNSSRYYGFETNSIALPASYASRGNVLYTAKSKDLEDYSYFNRVYDGNIMIQSEDNLYILSRTGQSNTESGARAYENQTNSRGNVQFLYTDSTNPNNNYVYLKSFDALGFSVSNFNKDDVKFGIDFTKGKFYIGDNSSNGNGYYFPSTRGNVGQVLKLNNSKELEWANATDAIIPGNKDQILTTVETSSVDSEGNTTTTKSTEWKNPENIYTSPKFFYMPSVVLPTNSTDVRILDVDNTNYTYDSSSNIYTVNLFELYKNQFTAPIVKSSTTASLDGFVLLANQYDYFITYADANVFTDITVSVDGILTYKVNTNSILKTGSFMNIVLKVK